jgi:hypothetical protein
MRRFALLPLVGLLAVNGCGDDNVFGVPKFSYTLQPAAPTIVVGQDSSVVAGVTVMRSGTDTSLKNVKLIWSSANQSIALVDTGGKVTGLSGGSTTVTAAMGATSLTIPVTVTGHAADFVELTVLSGPGGGFKSVSADTGTFFALPGDGGSSRLKAVVKVGNDTVFCNYCVEKTPARVLRVVKFRSLDTLKATVTNGSNPSLKTSTDTSGRVIPKDTSSTGVRIVLEVPGDKKADTVLLKFSLRPIDTLRIRPDSVLLATTNGTGLSKTIYPTSDTLAAVVVAASVTNFVAGVTFISKVQDLPAAGVAALPALRSISIRTDQGAPANLRRLGVPSITWESANKDYLTINAAGASIGLCSFIGGNCSTTGSTVLNCNSLGTAMPQTFAGAGTYTVPGCVGKAAIPMPGALCTTTSSTEVTATCTIWIRATVTDPVTKKVIQRLYPITIRR